MVKSVVAPQLKAPHGSRGNRPDSYRQGRWQGRRQRQGRTGQEAEVEQGRRQGRVGQEAGQWCRVSSVSSQALEYDSGNSGISLLKYTI